MDFASSYNTTRLLWLISVIALVRPHYAFAVDALPRTGAKCRGTGERMSTAPRGGKDEREPVPIAITMYL